MVVIATVMAACMAAVWAVSDRNNDYHNGHYTGYNVQCIWRMSNKYHPRMIVVTANAGIVSQMSLALLQLRRGSRNSCEDLNFRSALLF